MPRNGCGRGRAPVVIAANAKEPASDLVEYQQKIDDIDPKKLSHASKTQYKAQLKRLTETVGKGVEWILGHGPEAKALLLAAKRTDGRAMLDAPMTLKAMIDPLVAMLKHVPGLKAKYPDVKSQWWELYKKAGDAANERYENNEATAKSVANFVPWTDILAKRDALIKRSHSAPATSMDVVVAALHTFIPPARADYDRVRVYRPPRDPPPPPLPASDDDDEEPADGEKAEEGGDEKTGKKRTAKPPSPPPATATDPDPVERFPNYVVWTKTGRSDGTMHLVLDEFKTRKKQQAAHEADLPDELVAVLARSLEADPRKFLVVSPDNGEPFASANAYSKYVQRVFTRLIGRHTTVNSLRHAFSSQLDLNTLTPKQRKEIADALMHSPDMTHRYRWANVEGAMSSTPKAVVASATSTGSDEEPKVTTVQCQLVCKKKVVSAAAAKTKPVKTSGGGGKKTIAAGRASNVGEPVTLPMSKAKRYLKAIEAFDVIFRAK
jgi:hypothetical protein